MARGSLDGRARRVRRLEAGMALPPPSRTQEEARALEAEIREVERELQVLGVDPYKSLPGASVDLPLDEHIAKLEAEIAELEAEIAEREE